MNGLLHITAEWLVLTVMSMPTGANTVVITVYDNTLSQKTSHLYNLL